jgi:hypothetical protein
MSKKKYRRATMTREEWQAQKNPAPPETDDARRTLEGLALVEDFLQSLVRVARETVEKASEHTKPATMKVVRLGYQASALLVRIATHKAKQAKTGDLATPEFTQRIQAATQALRRQLNQRQSPATPATPATQ